MKIDEACIDHNITRLILDHSLPDIATGTDSDEVKDMAFELGVIEGLMELGEALKEVLRS